MHTYMYAYTYNVYIYAYTYTAGIEAIEGDCSSFA